jgi:hypothetical protein
MGMRAKPFLPGIPVMEKDMHRKDHTKQSGEDPKGRNKGGALGPGGFCICAKCGEKLPHKKGIKCTRLKCPKCGKTMIREELLKR